MVGVKSKLTLSEAGRLGGLKTALISHNQSVENYYKNPNRCQFCNKIIDIKKNKRPSAARKQKFCDHSCAGKNKCKRKCKGCGGRIDRKGCNYCSKCASEGKNKIVKPLIDVKASVTLRRRLLKEREHKCVICELTDWMGKPIPLIVDHIDGNSSNSADKNLRLVCGNCDMQLPTYKGRNKNSGRFKRRERYRLGLSY